MNFISWSFAILLGVAIIGRLTLRSRDQRPRYLTFLLFLSLLFYSWHVPQYIWILLLSAVVDFWTAQRLGAVKEPLARRLLLAASLIVNLGLLCYFKYADFFIVSIERVALASGFDAVLPRLDLLLPMGISFYTFQSMSYTIDVYRRVIEPIGRFSHFLLYVSFFPQLVAGPIVRATEFFPQLAKHRRWTIKTMNEAAALLVSGFFYKMVCADNLGFYVDRFWDQGFLSQSATTAIFLAFCFSMQIFCDFSGYSRIARGTALLLGFRIPVNFNAPYLASSFKNFWQRWHITLSRWLRDYLYIPLGGNRGSKVRTTINLMLTMVLGGLWHGAGLHFVAWGFLHGAALAVERTLGLEKNDSKPRTIFVRCSWFLIVQIIVLISWVLFRTPSLRHGLEFIDTAFTGSITSLPHGLGFAAVFLIPPLLLHIRSWASEKGWLPESSGWEQALTVGVMLALTLTFYGTNNAFIYFQF